jgi:hypothetical protein
MIIKRRDNVLTALVINNFILCDIGLKSCSPLIVNDISEEYVVSIFRAEECVMQETSRIMQAFLAAIFMFGVLLSPEDGGDMFLGNVGWRPTDYTALYCHVYGVCVTDNSGFQIRWRDLLDTHKS